MKNFVVSQSCIKRFSEEEYLARTTMSDLIKAISHTALVVSATVLLCLFIPASTLLEFFFVLLGGLIIIGGGVLITREVTKLIDLRNRCSFSKNFVSSNSTGSNESKYWLIKNTDESSR